jgi:hypothetical protein
MSSRPRRHTYDSPEVKELAQSLLEDFARPMLEMVTSNVKDTELKVGTCMKVLLGFKDVSYVASTCSDIIVQLISDVETLVAKCTDTGQLKLYNEELRFLTQCVELDDIITLNAVCHEEGR